VTAELLAARELRYRDPARARALAEALAAQLSAIGRRVTLMHVCGSHEQAIARFGLRACLPKRLKLMMGPGCPVCVTDAPEVDEAVALARRGIRIASFGDMLRVPGSATSLADERALGARVAVVYGVEQAVELARSSREELVFFATGFETTAVTTAAAILADPPRNFSVLSAHKYIPPAMEAVASLPDAQVDGFLAAGHAATITGWGLFEGFAERHRLPVVVAGFEPLDILAGLVSLLALVGSGAARVVNMYPRCVTREGNRRALAQLEQVFEAVDGRWRGIAEIPGGNLRLREAFGRWDARRRFASELALPLPAAAPQPHARDCICGRILSGSASPPDCTLFGRECVPDAPLGACMVSSEGACRIWHSYGGPPELEASP
jgi:hydrogenase expression/formation protein HypD